MARVVRLPALHARQPHLGGAEEQRIDLVEVTIVPLERVVKRRAIILGRGGRNPGDELRQLRIAGLYGIMRAAPVQDAVVGATDGAKVVLRDGRQGRRADAADDPVTSKPSVSILCKPVSRIRAAICTPPARLAVGAAMNVSAAGGRP